MDLQIGWAETTSGGVFNGNEVRWHFDNFDPAPDSDVQNMEFALVAPVAWQTVLIERDNVAKNPNDSEAWGRLGKAYKQIFLMGKGYRTDAGGEELYQSSIAAYEKCLALKPDDAQWHAGFADLLASRSYYDAYYGPTPDTYRALDEIHTALQLAPNDPKVLEIAQNISYMFPEGMTQNGDGYDFPWLTQTPTPHPPTPRIVPVAPATPVLTATETPQTTPSEPAPAAPASKPSLPICGSAALIGVIWLVRKRR
jgi:tetratricopeptide (TPR) repeat protein